MKRCSRCREEKESDQFTFDTNQKDGRSTYCKVCVKARREDRDYVHGYSQRGIYMYDETWKKLKQSKEESGLTWEEHMKQLLNK